MSIWSHFSENHPQKTFRNLCYEAFYKSVVVSLDVSPHLIETLEAKAVHRTPLPTVHVVPKCKNDLNEPE